MCNAEAQGPLEHRTIPSCSIASNSSLAAFKRSGANLLGRQKIGGPGVVLI